MITVSYSVGRQGTAMPRCSTRRWRTRWSGCGVATMRNEICATTRYRQYALARRGWLAAAGAGLAATVVSADDRGSRPALIAITLDLEMSRNFPTWETTHWDYEKGNLNDQAKAYVVEAARRVKE